MQLFSISDVANFCVDAAVSNQQHELIFLSAYGFDTAIQEFISRLSISRHQPESLRYFSIPSDDRYYGFQVESHERLIKRTNRIQKESLFGGLVHLWLYDRSAAQTDHEAGKRILVRRHSEHEHEFMQRLWQMVRTLCTVPLLPEWQFILPEFLAKGWITHRQGINIDAYLLDFSTPEIEHCISEWVREGRLSIPPKVPKLSLVK